MPLGDVTDTHNENEFTHSSPDFHIFFFPSSDPSFPRADRGEPKGPQRPSYRVSNRAAMRPSVSQRSTRTPTSFLFLFRDHERTGPPSKSECTETNDGSRSTSVDIVSPVPTFFHTLSKFICILASDPFDRRVLRAEYHDPLHRETCAPSDPVLPLPSMYAPLIRYSDSAQKKIGFKICDI